MSAQKELTELNDAIVKYCGLGSDPLNGIKASRMSFALIRDHGPAIAELIRLAKFSLPYLPDGDECCGFPEWGGSTDNPPECCGKPINPRTEMTELVCKLTEPKA